MKKLSLSLTAWLLSLTALLLSALLLTSCGNKAEKATSPKVSMQYDVPLEYFTLKQVKG